MVGVDEDGGMRKRMELRMVGVGEDEEMRKRME